MSKDRPGAGERIDTIADKAGTRELGQRAPVTRAKRKPKAPVERDPVDAAAAAHLRRISTDLHAKDRKGNPIPTLAERIRSEGFRAQLGAKRKPKGRKR